MAFTVPTCLIGLALLMDVLERIRKLPLRQAVRRM
jgi:hypothetical protein